MHFLVLKQRGDCCYYVRLVSRDVVWEEARMSEQARYMLAQLQLLYL